MYLPEWTIVWLGGLAVSGLLALFPRMRVMATWLALMIASPVLAAAAAGVMAFYVGPMIYRDPETGGDSYGFVLAFMIVGAVIVGALTGLILGIVLARRITRKAPIF